MTIYRLFKKPVKQMMRQTQSETIFVTGFHTSSVYNQEKIKQTSPGRIPFAGTYQLLDKAGVVMGRSCLPF